MTKNQLKNFLNEELSRLNQKIDWKIASGYSYKDDARRHKDLLVRVKKINRRSAFRSWAHQMRNAIALF